MKKNIFLLLLSAILYILSNGRIITKTAKTEIARRRTERERRSQEIQRALDAQYHRGYGISAYDGRRVTRVTCNA